MKRYEESSMRELYQQFQESGLGKKAFAQSHGVSPSTFYYWIKKFEGQSLPSSTTANGFHKVSIDHQKTDPLTATVHYPSGVVLEWHGEAHTIHLLKTLL